MKNRRNYYRVLQVQPDAPFEVIRASYKTLMRELKQHPDLGGDVWRAQLLNEAYETLSDANKRHNYDRTLFERYNKKPVRDHFNHQIPFITLFCRFCKRPLAREANPGETCPTCKSPLQSLAKDDLSRTCRRATPRIKKFGTFNFYSAWPQKGMTGELVDISIEGMRFKTKVKLSAGVLLKISGVHFTGIVKINNIHKLLSNGQTTYSVGAEFVSVKFKEQKGSFYSSVA